VEEHDFFVALEQTKSGVKIFGEWAGVITAVSSDLKQLSVGDHICGLGSENHRSCTRFDGSSMHRMPTKFSLEAAASIPGSFVITYHGLTKLANVKRRDISL
jgi:NADPH:quinone reductase-like Zn-dependent oxidoreductase